MEDIAPRIARVLDAKPVAWEQRSGGYSTAQRFSVLLDDGRRVFVKAASEEQLARWIRREHEVYSGVRGSFIPELEGFDDDGIRPLLVLEDLSDAEWEPRWTPARIEAVRAALAGLAATRPPPNTRSVRETFAGLFGRWREVEREPGPFLSLGLRTPAWLERALPVLLEAADAVPADGDALLHMDVRSDNLCIRDGGALLVDWNWASVGNADLDLAGWLPSLRVEGGPQPWDVLPEGGEFAAFLAGVWAAVAGLPPPETAPNVRAMQRAQLAVALDWCDRELGLERYT